MDRPEDAPATHGFTTGLLHRVLLLKDTVDPDLYKARPAYAAVANGDKVRFVNHTTETVVIEFLGPNPFGLQGVIEIAPTQRSADLGVVGDNIRYPYKGRVGTQENALQGESSPEIIIDD